MTRRHWLEGAAGSLFAGRFRQSSGPKPGSGAKLEPIVVSADGSGFVRAESKRPFIPWGFNYDHDEGGRLIEDYWHAEWEKVAEDFQEMVDLGANVARIHLQFGKFMIGPNESNAKELERLGKLLVLAEEKRIYLDLTGLGCYHKKDVPAWYDALDEEQRWAAQVRFWEAVSTRCAGSPAVFCFDLMNEPVVPRGTRKPGDWLGPPFAGKHFVQVVTLDQKNRPRAEIARHWIATLAAAVRKHDPRRLITVGLVDWSLDRPGLTSGFVPKTVVAELDFLCVHLYPEGGKVVDAIVTLKGFQVGKPVVIEETFPLKCSTAEFRKFLDDSRQFARGWVGFYWGKTRDECRKSGTIGDAMMLGWLDLFRAQKSKIVGDEQ